MAPSKEFAQPLSSCISCGAPASAQHYDPVSAILSCTKCGTVQSTSSSYGLEVLTERVQENETDLRGRVYLAGGETQFAGSSLAKSLGDHVGAYHEKRKAESEIFIRSILQYFSLSSLSSRAKAIFADAKRVGGFKWGDKARIFAAASVYLAAREREKNVMLAELAIMTDIDETTLSRAHNNIKAWLGIKTADIDPLLFLERPLVCLGELFAQPNPPLSNASSRKKKKDGSEGQDGWSKQNLEFARRLDLAKVRNLATGLLAFGADLKLSIGRAPEGVAAAAILVGMEGVAKKTLPSANEFLAELSELLGVKPFTIAERYREFNKVLADFAPRLPWLSLPKGGTDAKRKKEMIMYTEDIVRFRANLDAQALKDERARSVPRLGQVDHELPAAVPVASGSGDGDDAPTPGSSNGGDDGDDDDDGGHGDTVAAEALLPDPLVDKTAAKSLFEMLEQTGKMPRFGKFIKGKDDGGKRPGDYMRNRSGPIKRIKTISEAALSLVSASSSSTPTSSALPSPAPPPSMSPAPPARATSQALSDSTTDHDREEDDVVEMTVPRPRRNSDLRSTVYPAHSQEAVRLRKLLLEGHDLTAILGESAGAYPTNKLFNGSSRGENSAAGDNGVDGGESRLSRLLWFKDAEQVADDELFDEGELETIVRPPDEVEKLQQLPRFRNMTSTIEPPKRPFNLKNPRKKKRKIPPRLPPKEEGEGEAKAGGPGTTATTDDNDPDGFVRKRKSKIDQTTASRIQQLLNDLDDEGGSDEEGDGEGQGGDDTESRLELAQLTAAADAANAGSSDDGAEE